MALDGTYATGSSVNNTNHATFIPKLWSDEIIAEYEKSLVMKPLVKSMKMVGKKGDTINIPMPVRGSANQKLTETQVTLVADQSGNKQIVVDQHWEYSRLIEDITSVQAFEEAVGATGCGALVPPAVCHCGVTADGAVALLPGAFLPAWAVAGELVHPPFLIA